MDSSSCKTPTPSPASTSKNPVPKPSTDFQFNHKMAEMARLQHCKLRDQQHAQVPTQSNPHSKFPLQVEPALDILYVPAESKFTPYPTYDNTAAQRYPPRAPTQEAFRIDYKHFNSSISSPR